MRYYFNNLTLTVTHTGSKPAPWSFGPSNFNHHFITVKNNDNGKRLRFDFWTSNARPVIERREDALWALRCFVDDAACGIEDFADFCDEYGYTDPPEALRIWKACRTAYQKFTRVFADQAPWEMLERLETEGIY